MRKPQRFQPAMHGKALLTEGLGIYQRLRGRALPCCAAFITSSQRAP